MIHSLAPSIIRRVKGHKSINFFLAIRSGISSRRSVERLRFEQQQFGSLPLSGLFLCRVSSFVESIVAFSKGNETKPEGIRLPVSDPTV